MRILLNNSTLELKQNTVIVVLGASGDLAKKKTVSGAHIPKLHATHLADTLIVPCAIRSCKQYLGARYEKSTNGIN